MRTGTRNNGIIVKMYYLVWSTDLKTGKYGLKSWQAFNPCWCIGCDCKIIPTFGHSNHKNRNLSENWYTKNRQVMWKIHYLKCPTYLKTGEHGFESGQSFHPCWHLDCDCQISSPLACFTSNKQKLNENWHKMTASQYKKITIWKALLTWNKENKDLKSQPSSHPYWEFLCGL